MGRRRVLEVRNMLFGVSMVKLMVILVFAVLLFGVPLISFIIVLKERREAKTEGDRRWVP